MCSAGMMGSSEDIPKVSGIHMPDLSDAFQGVTIGNFTLQSFEYIKGGVVYRLDKNTTVVTPDGWI